MQVDRLSGVLQVDRSGRITGTSAVPYHQPGEWKEGGGGEGAAHVQRQLSQFGVYNSHTTWLYEPACMVAAEPAYG